MKAPYGSMKTFLAENDFPFTLHFVLTYVPRPCHEAKYTINKET